MFRIFGKVIPFVEWLYDDCEDKMKRFNLLPFLGLFLVLTFLSCKESSVEEPTTLEEDVNIKDYVYNVKIERQLCLEKIGGFMHTQPSGQNVISISKDKNIVFGSNWKGYLRHIGNGINREENFDFSSFQQGNFSHQVLDFIFSPYDNNLGIALVNFQVVNGAEIINTSRWFYYDLITREFTKFDLDNSKHSYYLENQKIVRWLNTSTQGNDKFFWDNNTILAYPSGNILPNPTGFQIRENERVYSISPDGKHVFTFLDSMLYFNGNKVEKSQYYYWYDLPINWSEDSKYFLGVGLEANIGAQLNVVYRITQGSSTTFKIHKILDITRKYCSIQFPTGFGYKQYSHSSFLSDTSIIMTLFRDYQDVGKLHELNYNADIVKKF